MGEEALTADQSADLAHKIDRLRKHADHEYFYAALDGKEELEERKAEYRHKEQKLLARYQRIAASNTVQAAQNVSVGTKRNETSLVLALASLQTQLDAAK